MYALFCAFVIVMTIVTVARYIRSGVSNHYDIQESIDLLKKTLGAPKTEYIPSQPVYDRFLEDIGSGSNLTAMAYDILKHCSNQQWNITVSGAKKLGSRTAGQYTPGWGRGEILIKIGDDAAPNIIFSVLIHECMHHFLMTNNIGFDDTRKNEVLTDTAALYLGFSKYMNRGYIGVGYLSYRELLYAEKLINS